MKQQAQFVSNTARPNADPNRTWSRVLLRAYASLKAALAEPEPAERNDSSRSRDSIFQPPKY